MRKQRAYDFDKLFPGQQPPKQTTVMRQPRSKESAALLKVNHLAETRNPNIQAKPHRKEGKEPVRSSRNTSGYTDSSRGSSAEKTSRKPSVANIQLVASRQHQPRELTVSRAVPFDQVEQFFSGLGTRTVVKYVPVALHHERKSVKRNLTSQILAVRLGSNYGLKVEEMVVSHHRIESQPSSLSKPIHGITLTTSAVRSPLLQSTSRVLAHKNSCQSIASSSVSSRYSSVQTNQGQVNNLRQVNERFRQSE